MVYEPTQVQILEQLEKIAASKLFAGSPRKQKFLRYIVEKTLSGEAASLKGYSIGIDVFERDESFDPQSDTIVRVQARILRSALEQYYASDGKRDKIRIEVPKGSYIPTFSKLETIEVRRRNLQSKVGISKNFGTKENGDRSRISRITPTFILSIIGIVFLVVFAVNRGAGDRTNAFDQAALIATGPSVAILPFELISQPADRENFHTLESLQSGLHYELVDKISRFKDIFVVEIKTDPRTTDAVTTKGGNTQYLLSGSIQKSEGQLRITSILSRTVNGMVVWSRSYDREIDSSATFLEIQSSIAVDVAASLGRPDSQLHSRFIAEQSKMADMQLEHYYCLMRFYRYLDRKSEEQHFEIRNCLEVATTNMPSFSSGWAALTWMYADENFNNFNPRPDQNPPLQRALNVARRAVAADSENAMAHQYLAMAQFWNGNDREFIAAAQTALDLNPNDAEVLALFGNYLIRMNKPKQGLPLIEKALLLNPAPPSWYYGSLVINHYLNNESKLALDFARKFYLNDSLASHSLYVVVLVQNGQMSEAQAAFNNLVDKYSYFPDQYERLIKSRRIPNGLYQKMVDDLILAGLSPVN